MITVLGWLQKMPIVSLCLAAAIVWVPLQPEMSPGAFADDFEASREAARSYLLRNPGLEVDELGERLVGSDWLAEATNGVAPVDPAGPGSGLTPRLRMRAQAKLDVLLEEAYQARVVSDPAWRFGVLKGSNPGRNYFAHAFVQEEWVGVILCLLVLVLAGIPLERTWGHTVFAVFTLAVIPGVPEAYRLLDGSSSIPWSGGSGFAAALLGAYFIRGLGGHFVIPGWTLLSLWLATESFVVRGFWLDDLGSVPWATLCAAVALGAGFAGILRLARVEDKVDTLSASTRSGAPHPSVARAARLRADGAPYEAFDLMHSAWLEDPRDVELGEAFFTVAAEVGQPEAAVDAIVPSLRNAVRKGEMSRALDYWLPLARQQCEASLEAKTFIRLGEAMLGAGHVEEALFTLRSALDVGATSALATRIVRLAREHDKGLARAAAAIALADSNMAAKVRAELQSFTTSAEASAVEPPMASPAPAPVSRSALDRRVQAEHQSIDTTTFPLELDTIPGVPTPGSVRAASEIDSNESALVAQGLDIGAIDAGQITDLTESQAQVDNDLSEFASSAEEISGDGALPGPGLRPQSAEGVERTFQDDDLERPSSDSEFLTEPILVQDLAAGRAADPAPDSDRTPLVAVDETGPSFVDLRPEDEASGVFDEPTVLVGMVAEQEEAATDALGPESVSESARMRGMKVVQGTPTTVTEEWIEIEIEGKGKTKLPLERIQAMSLALVADLAPGPVLVVDFLLNWLGPTEEPLKLIRLRSDRFDPLVLMPGVARPSEALTLWIRGLEARTDLACLPSRVVLRGEYAHFETLEEYEREVLIASSEA